MAIAIEFCGGANLELQSNRCFLCDDNFVAGQHKIFEQRLAENGEQTKYLSLSELLMSAIGRELKEFEVHSTVLCAACHKTLSVFERLEQQLCDIRLQILYTYNQTAKKHNLEPISYEFMDSVQDAFELLIESVNDENDNNKDILPEKVQLNSIEYCPIDDQDQVEEDVNKLLKIELIDVGTVDDAIGQPTIETNFLEYNIDEQPEEDEEEEETELLKLEPENLLESNDLDVELNDQDIAIYNDIIEQTGSEHDNPVVDSESHLGECETQLQQHNDDLMVQDHFIFLRNDDSFLCQVCNVSAWLDLANFANHMRTAHKYSISTCYLCSEIFFSKQKLDDHIDRQHSDVTSFECFECNRQFANYRLLQKHKRVHATSEKQHNCHICQEAYNSRSALAAHMHIHRDTNWPYICDECGKEFSTKYSLQTHVKIHGNRQRPFKCDDCDKTFLKQQSLLQHKKLHIGTKDFICEVCSKAFRTQHNLDVHSIVHSGQRPFVCRTCGKSFARRGDVRDHERIHTGERPFKCDICGMAFAQRSNLMTHKKSTHMNEKQHKCLQCGRSFKRRRLLDYHMRAVHTGERPHKCKTCGSAFVYPDHLKKHMIIHSGNKPYACEFCGKQFNSRENRNAHRFTHSDKKPYECVDCGAGFMRKPLLFAHIKQFKHSNHTIIVNQINKGVISKVVQTDANIDSNPSDDEDNMLASIIDTDETLLEEIDSHHTAKTNSDIIEDNNNATDMKYLELDDIGEENSESFSWVIIKDDNE